MFRESKRLTWGGGYTFRRMIVGKVECIMVSRAIWCLNLSKSMTYGTGTRMGVVMRVVGEYVY